MSLKEGVDLAVGRLDPADGAWQSQAFFMDRAAIRIGLDVSVTPQSGAATVDVKIRQGVSAGDLAPAGLLPDRGVTVPASFASASTAVREIISDDVVGTWVQFEISSDAPVFVTAYACAR